MKNVLIIDDSALMRRVLSDIIEETNEYKVEYTAVNGIEGLKIIEEKQDELVAVLCDIHMPRMNGIELLQVLNHKEIKLPFIMCSSVGDSRDTITALELGAMEFIKKPERILGKTNFEFEKRVYDALKAAYELKIRYDNKDNPTDTLRQISEPVINLSTSVKTKSPIKKKTKSNIDSKQRLVAIVCSTGGPKALQSVIPYLPENLAAPVVVVQHMPAGFTDTLAKRLDSLSAVNVKEAADGELLQNGTVYIAKGGSHLLVRDEKPMGRLELSDEPPVVGLKPCGNLLYDSLCGLGYKEIICVVLTGMGSDGTKGIRDLSVGNDIYVIAQDAKSCTVYGMPKAIYESGLTDYICDLKEIAKEITKKVGVL